MQESDIDCRIADSLYLMARTSKFSFPLPGRSLITAKGSNADEPISHPIEDNSQMPNGKQSKAERLLGATDFGPLDKMPKSTRPKKAPKEKHSFVSISVSETSQDHASNGDEGIDPATTTDNWKPPPLSPRGLLPRPSSPLLGRHFHDPSIRTEKRDVSPNNGLHESRSSSTLRSYYDPANSPLSVSQQTSASSARDLALRKGCKPVIDSRHHSASQNAMDITGTNSNEQIHACESPRKRPPRLDFSRLFPRPHMFSGSLLSPTRVTTSPSPLSMASDILPSAPINAKEMSSRTNSSTGLLSVSKETKSSYFASAVERTNEPVVSVKKPRQGLKHWFNATEEDDHLDGSTWESRPSQEGVQDLQCAPTSGTESCSSWHTLPKPLLNTQSDAQLFKTNDALICLSSSFGEASSMHCPLSPKSKISRKSTGSVFSSSDLQNESVLALSSSEDEDESDGQASTCNSTHCHRNIAASTRRHDNVNRDGALSVPALRPVKIHAHSDSILSSESRSSAISARNDVIAGRNGLPRATFLHPPSIYYPRHKRAPGTKPSEFISEDLRPKSSNDATARSPSTLGGFVPTPTSPSRSESRIPLRKSRIMAVTREEESLLEAMRQKKAAMRQNNSVPTDTQTLELGPSRPVSYDSTANLAVSEKRLRFAEEPLPAAGAASALTHGVARSRTSGFLDNASISSATWPSNTTAITYLSVPNFSPNLHLTPSEYNSSSPPSRASPKTPPSEVNVTSLTPMEGSGMTTFPAAGIVQDEVRFQPYSKESPGYDGMDLHTKAAGDALALA